MLRRLAAVLLLATAALAACDAAQAGARSSRSASSGASQGVDGDRSLPAEALEGEVLDQGEWREVGRWRGDGAKNTPSFAVRSREWRVIYSIRNVEESGGSLTLYVKKVDEDAHVTSSSKRSVGTDTTYVHDGPGRFYMEFSTWGASWEVVAQDRQLPAERVNN